MTLRGEKITLSPLTIKHIPKCWEWMNNKEATKFIGVKAPKTYKDELKWFRNLQKSKTEKIFAITDKKTGTYIGNIGLHEISKLNENCTLGILIGEKAYWSHGYGTDAIKTLLAYCFGTLKFHKVNLTVFSKNFRAQRCYKKCGFEKVGYLKDSIKKDGKFVDIHWMEVISPITPGPHME